jgi:hypothetical protein
MTFLAILRPGCDGCSTAGNPVPPHAGHLTSAIASFGLGFFNSRPHFFLGTRSTFAMSLC